MKFTMFWMRDAAPHGRLNSGQVSVFLMLDFHAQNLRTVLASAICRARYRILSSLRILRLHIQQSPLQCKKQLTACIDMIRRANYQNESPRLIWTKMMTAIDNTFITNQIESSNFFFEKFHVSHWYTIQVCNFSVPSPFFFLSSTLVLPSPALGLALTDHVTLHPSHHWSSDREPGLQTPAARYLTNPGKAAPKTSKVDRIVPFDFESRESACQ